jgi:hypothetical protein
VITHGHPHGFCGAIFHGLLLHDTLAERRIPSPSSWANYVESFSTLESVVNSDRQLEAFWAPAWEQVAGRTFLSAAKAMREEALSDIDTVSDILRSADPSSYRKILTALGCFEERYRGSGWKTALAAACLAWLFRNERIEAALVTAANELQSDTDTIGTMGGALLGIVSDGPPDWPIQDRVYLEAEARRLGAIGAGETRDAFSYPDLARWTPPASQNDAVVRIDTGLAIVGLGETIPEGEVYSVSDSIWQWLKLPFEQTVLCKRRITVKELTSLDQLPGKRRSAQSFERHSDNFSLEPSLPLDVPDLRPSKRRQTDRTHRIEPAQAKNLSASANGSIDIWTDEVIHSDFDDRVLGRLLNLCIDQYGTVEGAATFAGIIAKAKIARNRRRHL